MQPVDVIIVGLGPTGVTLAGLLGRAGYTVAVFEKLPDLYPLPRAIGLDHEAMRIFQQMGVADQLQEHVAPYRPSEYLGVDGKLIKRLDTIPEPYPLGWAPNYVFSQPALERVLRTDLANYSNVHVHLSTEVVDSGQSPEHAWVEVQPANETCRQRCYGRYLVACDGGASPIRKRLGISLQDLNFDEPWLVVDAIVPDEKLQELPQTQVQYCDPERPSTFVVGPGNHRRWEVTLLPGDSIAADFPETELWPLLQKWVQPGEAEIWRAAAYRFHGLIAKSWRQRRIFLAGDTAHMTPPFMAQGMVSGLRDAHNLAWKLQYVMEGRAGDALLDTYQAERLPHVRQAIESAISLGRVICERDPARAAWRDQQLRAAHNGRIPTEYRQNMIPNLEAGLINPNDPLAGQLFPQPTVRSGDFSGRLDDLTGARLRVILKEPVEQSLRAQLSAAVAPLDGVVVDLLEAPLADSKLSVIDETGLLGPWMQEAGRAVVVVRPDHYVYGSAESAEAGLRLVHKLRAALA